MVECSYEPRTFGSIWVNNGYPTITHIDPCRFLLNEALNRKMSRNKKCLKFFVPLKMHCISILDKYLYENHAKKRWGRTDIGNLISNLKSTQKISKKTLVSPMHYF